MLCDDDHNYLVLIQGWGWGWYANTWQGPTTIEGNHIHHHLSLLGDGAGIYTLGPEGNLPFASGPQYGPGAVTATCHCFACLRPVSVRSSGLSRACLGESSCFIAYVTNIAHKLTHPPPPLGSQGRHSSPTSRRYCPLQSSVSTGYTMGVIMRVRCLTMVV